MSGLNFLPGNGTRRDFKRTAYAFSTVEVNHHKDITILGLVSSIFAIALKEGTKDSDYTDSRKIYYDSDSSSIDKLRHTIFSYYADFKEYRSRLKKRDNLAVTQYEKLANDIYIKIEIGRAHV